MEGTDPLTRTPENCAFTTQHNDPDAAQTEGASPTAGLGMPNGGLQVVNPSKILYESILERMKTSSAVENYEFADQSLLSDLFQGRWVALPYIYNALKTLRWKNVHAPIWRDPEVKNIHYILNPKPWDEQPGEEVDETHAWWQATNAERLTNEEQRDIKDGF
jgi:lipopolysaccharide biosynthesis glycosyltransferase